MDSLRRLLPVALFTLALIAGAHAGEKHDKHDHDKPGPHGGEIQEMGDKADTHAELVHDHKNGKVLLYLLGDDMKKPVAIKDAPKINLKSKSGNKQVEMKAVEARDGVASQWEASHDEFKNDPLDGRISVKLPDGKKYNLKLDAHHHDDHDHKHDGKEKKK